MKKVIDRASSRGYFNHGWLKTHHTFSFANYYNPERIHFGALRVLNDDGGTRLWDSIHIRIKIWK